MGPFLLVSGFYTSLAVFNASFSVIYQPDLTIVGKNTTFEVDVRLENLKI